jgi:hypothetical protein
MLAALLARWVPSYEREKDKYLLNAVLILLAFLAMTKAPLSAHQLDAQITRLYPERAAGYLQKHSVPGPMFNEESWGDYLIWKFNGRHKVFVDTRTVPYEESEVFGDYVRIMFLDQEALPLIAKYDIRSCLVDRGAALTTLLSVMPDWERVFEDDIAVIFVRKNPVLPQGRGVIGTYR